MINQGTYGYTSESESKTKKFSMRGEKLAYDGIHQYEFGIRQPLSVLSIWYMYEQVIEIWDSCPYIYG